MARRQAPLQVNEFTGGLVTEFNPLSIPPNISLDEINMEIDGDGSRFKRLGFNKEPNSVDVNTGVVYNDAEDIKTTLFRWDNAGGDASKSLLVVQVGNFLSIHNMDGDIVSDSVVYTETFPLLDLESSFSYSTVDGFLVVVNSNKEIIIYEYDGTSITKSTEILYIRDQFGVSYPGLTDSNNLTIRPTTLPDEHLYNLRNQTFNSPRLSNNQETPVDPISAFLTDATFHSSPKYPSNADDLNRYLFADPNDADNRTVERFFSRNMVREAPNASEAPKGHFIIDALERGTSRLEQEGNLRSRHPELTLAVTASSLPADTTPGGASVIESYAGRVWFGGFSGQLIGGDLKSPRMSSYILFSSLVRDRSDITRCYQRADPTSNEDSALVDTDGGFIRLDGAYGINQMISLEGSLFVFAKNGVWRVNGGEGNSFSATNYSADKLSNEGCIAPDSVVLVNSKIYYWGDKAIFSITRNQFGFWEVNDITKDKIETFYLDIPQNDRISAKATYEIFERKIRWIYTPISTQNSLSKELILDLNYEAFSVNSISTQGGGLPAVVDVVGREPTRSSTISSNVTINGENVTINGVQMTINFRKAVEASRRSLYLILTQLQPFIEYSFGYYQDETFYDWGAENYEAYLVTGALTGGEARFKKQTPYLNVFLKRTEDGFDSNLNATGQSSCMISSRWNWTSNSNTNKWSTPRQAYKQNRTYFPSDSADSFDTGETVIVTRNKIRGIGHAVSFKFSSEEGKNMHIHGWSFDLQANAVE